MADYSFMLTGRIPSKKNSRINTRNGMSFPSKKYSEWHTTASQQLDSLKGEGLDCPVSISYYFYLPDNRKTDLSNKIESINDLLVDINFIEDDNVKFVNQLHVYYMGVDRKEPRCEIKVSKIDLPSQI